MFENHTFLLPVNGTITIVLTKKVDRIFVEL